MSDIRIFNSKNKQVLDKDFITKQNIQDIVFENSFEILGVIKIATNINLTKDKEDILEFLGYDEDHRLVIIEFRENRNSSTIKRAWVFLDYIKQNYSKIKLLITEYLGKDLADEIIYLPRLICIGEDYSKYDSLAIKETQYEIDLIKAVSFNKGIFAFEKVYQSKAINRSLLKLDHIKDEQKMLFDNLSEFLLNLGDEVTEVGFDGFLSYRKIRVFLYVVFDEQIQLHLILKNKTKKIIVKNLKDLEKAKMEIELLYGEI
ncbi:MAG: hypothetical protein PHT83_02895 [Bacilli bacterium]|nr:hypothetical protein [Bacilli bacterium]